MEDTNTNSTVHANVSDRRRNEARILLAAQRAMLDEIERKFPRESTSEIQRVRELAREMDVWVAGGDVPASARRYVQLMTDQDGFCKNDRATCSCIQCSATRELEADMGKLDVVGDGLQFSMNMACGRNLHCSLAYALDQMITCADNLSDEDRLEDAHHDVVYRAAQDAAGGADAFDRCLDESEQRANAAQDLFNTEFDRTRKAYNKLATLFTVEEFRRLHKDVVNFARYSIEAPIACRIQALMQAAHVAGASYLGTLVEWGTMLLKRLPVETPRENRTVLAHVLELCAEVARGSQAPQVLTALLALSKRCDELMSENFEPAIYVAQHLCSVDWGDINEAAEECFGAGWLDAAVFLYCIAEITPAEERDDVLLACEQIAHRNLFGVGRVVANDNAEKTRRCA